MQTFLPYPNFRKSLGCLDNKRLGKQRVEAMQIVRALEYGDGAPWYNHPATQMWRGCIPQLNLYHDLSIMIWKERGFKNTMTPFYGLCAKDLVRKYDGSYCGPSWLGNAAFHASHRSNLLRKDFSWYGRFGWTEGSGLAYVWPVVAESG